MAYSVNTLLRRASALTGLTDAASSEDRALMDGWVNEGMQRIFQDTQCVITSVDVTLVAGQDEYALDRGVLTVLNYAQTDENVSSKIFPIPAQDILERRFMASSGPVRYYSVLGGNLLLVSPVPNTDQVIKFYCVPVPDLVDTTDDIFVTGLPTYGQRALECYVNTRCFEQARDFQSAGYWQKEYEMETSKMKVAQRRQAGRVIPASRIGYPGSYRGPTLNDVDTGV